jgi:quinone-modifying oxidoreductase subunit QmoC
MASIPAVLPSSDFRDHLVTRGGESAARCYQCATCSSVCELAPGDAPFPRQQMLYAQWGLIDRLAADPAPWLCHQCNDCNVRCPREAQPGDVMQTIRAQVVEFLAFPGAIGRLVGNVRATWPVLVLLPIIFWVVLLGAATGLHIPEVDSNLPALEGRFHYEHFVPHHLIYAVYFTATGWILLAFGVSASKHWRLMGAAAERTGSFLGGLISTLVDVATHKRFSTCDRGLPKRRWGHFLLMWGFVGAAITSGFAVVYLYKAYIPFSWVMPADAPDYPMAIVHWVKWLGNISAALLVVGAILLLVNRLAREDKLVGATAAFDRFFLWVVVAVIGTGVLTELFRFVAIPTVVACLVYVLHLGIVLCLFLTLPYSKFAHIVYRTLAMVHERSTSEK